jgi:hypothetical protein
MIDINKMSDKYELGDIIRYVDGEYSFNEGKIERILRNGKLTIKDEVTERNTDITSDAVVVNISYLEKAISDKIDNNFNYRLDDVCIKMAEIVKKYDAVLKVLGEFNDKMYDFSDNIVEINNRNNRCCTWTNVLIWILFVLVFFLLFK